MTAKLVIGSTLGHPGDQHFTRREGEILSLIARGLSSKQMGVELGVSPRTIETHLTRLYRRNNFPNRAAALVAWVRRQGL